MDADPWADAPPSPRPGSPKVSPTKHTNHSPLTQSSAAFTTQLPLASSSSRPPSPVAIPSSGDNFEEFDDFEAPGQVVEATFAAPDEADADGFGDFGDFEEGDFAGVEVDQRDQAVLGGEVVQEPDIVKERSVSDCPTSKSRDESQSAPSCLLSEDVLLVATIRRIFNRANDLNIAFITTSTLSFTSRTSHSALNTPLLARCILFYRND